MQLEPRHQRLIDFLTDRAPKTFGLDEIAKHLNQSMRVMRNEAPRLVEQGLIHRKPDGKTFSYYIPKTAISKYRDAPVTPEYLDSLLEAIATTTYTPVLTKLDWSMPYAVAHLMAGHIDQQKHAYQALEVFLKAVEATAETCRRLLSTPQLWDERLDTWVRSSLTEKSLERLSRLTSAALELHGRLEPSKKNPDNNLRNPIDYH